METLMTETNLGKVMALLAAIRAQDADKALQLVAPRFVQHTPYIADGVEGLRQYILDATPDQVKLSLVRAIADGQLVVAQLSWKVPAKTGSLFFDFRTDSLPSNGHSPRGTRRETRVGTRSWTVRRSCSPKVCLGT
jgi:predicted SnoaL-like aldol condensation-catalyzing enzyme